VIVYDAARCPYCARVRIVLAEKGLAYEPVEIDLSDRPAWLYEKNPRGKVPVLEEDGGLILPESTVIMEYLEERFPEPALWPADPAERALGRLWLDRFDDRLGDDYYALRRRDGSQLPRRLADIDGALEAQPYLTGREFGLADIGYVPWILRARSSLGVELDPYPALAGWLARLSERPAVAAELELQLQTALPAEAGTASDATSQATSRTL
jgi:glutathione S-transferase